MNAKALVPGRKALPAAIAGALRLALLAAAAALALLAGAGALASADVSNGLGGSLGGGAPGMAMPCLEAIPPGYRKIGTAVATYNTDYWHYVGDYWFDGGLNEPVMRDDEYVFWKHPELYYDRKSMQIRAEAKIPSKALALLESGAAVAVSAAPALADGINSASSLAYSFEGDRVIIHALPLFNVYENLSYRDFVPTLRQVIPIVCEGYGWNAYSMFRGGVSIGALGSSLRPDPDRIEFTDILDTDGHIKAGKVFHTFKGEPGSAGYTQFTTPSEAAKIGGEESFNDAGAVGMWFQFTFEVSFYEPPPGLAPQPGPAPALAPTPTPTPAPALPDLAVVGFRDGEYEELLSVTSHVRVRNTGSRHLAGVKVTFEVAGGGEEQAAYVDFAPDEEKEVAFEWWTGEGAGERSVSVSVNPGRVVEEADYSNNMRVFRVDVIDAPVDLSITGIVPTRYPRGAKVVTLVNVRNDSRRAVGMDSDDTVWIRFEIPAIGCDFIGSVIVPPGEVTQFAFAWTAAADVGSVQLKATVNPARSIAETDYSNNTFTQLVDIFADTNPLPGGDVNSRTWVESRNRGGKLVKVQFRASVSITATLSDRGIKSGYGVECLVTTSLSTDHVEADTIVGLQNVFAYLPTDGYTNAIKLERVWTSGDGYRSTWRFPSNSASVIGARKQYIPVSWPDGKAFEIRFTGYDAFCPGGAMRASTSASVMVNGSMYDDDYTAPR